MKSSTLITLLMLPLWLLAQSAAPQADREAIKGMCGCFEVTFQFAETFAPDTAYQFHDRYHATGLEWVELVQDEPDALMLQHLLIVGEGTVIKHWRQDWLYEHRDLYVYDVDRRWDFIQLPSEQAAGTWTQKVYQVDDSPRYEGSGVWVHVNGRSFWESYAAAPLPRREFSKRDDYNVMLRRNRHEISGEDWNHEQDNDKVVRSAAGDSLIAQEKGMNTYRRVPDERCAAAQQWWTDHADYWAMVRAEWDRLFALQQPISLKARVDEQPLFMHLFAMNEASGSEAIRSTIDQFLAQP